ncbi:hypothetical protein L3C95_06370 [Chitinophaga filiformis]|uniref:AAA family ATPase n=1 Tax=Chitinophaga filiformis TaxID=104663 RepID=UPI001F329FB2|nr:AAA family ATPase [Chitinophaga filiformis]MCF6402489.1 hypothetical protein [Chitinophaga filiformis]
MKIHIVGASCSGVTSLGEYLSATLNVPYFDTDEFYWEKSDPPFTIRRDPAVRNNMILQEFSQHNGWILGGSVIKWELDAAFDLIVFLWLPQDIRIERLKARELEKYGDIIYTDAERNKQFNEFIAWASGYDDNTARGRTLQAHQQWLAASPYPVLELKGDLSIQERAVKVMEKLSAIKQEMSLK